MSQSSAGRSDPRPTDVTDHPGRDAHGGRYYGQTQKAIDAGLSAVTVESVRQGCYSHAQLAALIQRAADPHALARRESLVSQSDAREERLRGSVAELEELAVRAGAHLDVMRSAVRESVRWSNSADVAWARAALDHAITSAAEAERDLRAARAIVGELFG